MFSRLEHDCLNHMYMQCLPHYFRISTITLFLAGQTKEFRLPPIDFTDTNRCVFQGSNMGQANAARDKLYDLRQCQLSGATANGIDLSGVIMSKTNVAKTNFRDSYFSKAYLRGKAC
jgi:uncharacterized protein YjbI with pentapeptide repeats